MSPVDATGCNMVAQPCNPQSSRAEITTRHLPWQLIIWIPSDW
jgi:hypothetical protein